MRRYVVLAFLVGCGDPHNSSPSGPPMATAPRPAPSDAAALIEDTTAAVPDAAVVLTRPATAPARRLPSTTQCFGNAMRCTLRVTAKGIYVDGDPKSRDEAVAACKRTVCALVALDDNAPAAEWTKLQAALRGAGIPILMRGVINDTECLNNPLARGCN